MRRILISPKAASESRVESIDFSPDLVSGQTISSAAVSVSVYSGTDAAPPAYTGSVSGSTVTVVLSGGVVGVIYLVRVTATAATPTASIVLAFYLAVIPDLP